MNDRLQFELYIYFIRASLFFETFLDSDPRGIIDFPKKSIAQEIMLVKLL